MERASCADGRKRPAHDGSAVAGVGGVTGKHICEGSGSPKDSDSTYLPLDKEECHAEPVSSRTTASVGAARGEVDTAQTGRLRLASSSEVGKPSTVCGPGYVYHSSTGRLIAVNPTATVAKRAEPRPEQERLAEGRPREGSEGVCIAIAAPTWLPLTVRPRCSACTSRSCGQRELERCGPGLSSKQGRQVNQPACPMARGPARLMEGAGRLRSPVLGRRRRSESGQTAGGGDGGSGREGIRRGRSG